MHRAPSLIIPKADPSTLKNTPTLQIRVNSSRSRAIATYKRETHNDKKKQSHTGETTIPQGEHITHFPKLPIRGSVERGRGGNPLRAKREKEKGRRETEGDEKKEEKRWGHDSHGGYHALGGLDVFLLV